MNFRHYFKSLLRSVRRKKISDEAYEWFAVLYSGDLTQDEFEEYLDWARKKPEAASQLKELETTWNKIPEHCQVDSPDKSLMLGIRKFITASGLPGYAAAALLVLTTGIVLIFNDTDAGRSTIIYETARAETNSINLADGSVVTLNVLSSIEVSYTAEERHVQLLQGEAFFKVAPDSTRPFVVSTDNSAVQALGTEFNTRLSRSEQLTVTLLEGSIKVTASENGSDPREAVLAQPGLQASIEIRPDTSRNNASSTNRSFNPIQISRVDVNNIISWQEGKLVFTGETLDAAIEIINSHTTHTIHLQAPELGQSPVFGVFNTGDWEGFLSAVESSYPLSHFDAGQDITVLSEN